METPLNLGPTASSEKRSRWLRSWELIPRWILLWRWFWTKRDITDCPGTWSIERYWNDRDNWKASIWKRWCTNDTAPQALLCWSKPSPATPIGHHLISRRHWENYEEHYDFQIPSHGSSRRQESSYWTASRTANRNEGGSSKAFCLGRRIDWKKSWWICR